jgi:Domain of unknown function (DUF4340)
MQTWKTIAVLFLLVIVGGYAYYVSRQPSTEQTAKLFTVKANDIQKIELRSPGRDIVVERAAGGWRMVKPAHAQADSSAADGMADAIANLEITSTIEEPGDLAPFGLKRPAVEVIVTTTDNHTLPPIMVGKDTPVGNSAYIKSPSRSGILLVSNSFPSQVEKSVDDLRTRTLITLKPEEVNKVVLASNNRAPVELEKKAGKWTIVKPKTYAADDTAVQNLLDVATSARVTDFIEDTPSDLSKYGLAHPAYTVTLYSGTDSAPESLMFGFKQPEAGKFGLYARRSGNGDEPVVTVDNYVFTDLDKNFDDLRDKTLLPLEQAKVERVVIASGPLDETLVRATGDNWNIISNDKTAKAEKLVAESLVDQLHDLKATRIIEDPMTNPLRYGMVKPTLQLTAYAKEGTQIGTVRLSTVEMILNPKSPASAPEARAQHRYFAYATTTNDLAVSEVSLQSVTDLENTIRRLHSDVVPTAQASPKATPAHAAAASSAPTPASVPVH